MKKEKFYITTAIDYVNAEPHIGHAYQKVIADVLARWNRFLEKEVLFVTGTDEHGKKVQEAAKKAGIPVKEFVDNISNHFKESWNCLNIIPDRFIRTTDEDHKKIVKEFILKCQESGDIYLGEYSGLYCTGCEQFYTDGEFENNICPIHNRALEKLEEKSYFFNLSKYKDFLLNLYKSNPEFIQPQIRKNEIISRVKEGLHDLSISRTSFDWGIPFPLDKKHVTYVWFDALINYYTATRKKEYNSFWGKPTVHLIGKDNAWFHAVYWPAMLKSANISLPRGIFNHGFLTFNGQKISKSLGNSISPKILVKKYSADAVRYFICRHFSFASGQDGDFSEEALVNRYNGELVNKLGNLVSRVSGLIEKNGLEKSNSYLELNFKFIIKLMENFEIDKALNEIFAFIDKCNEYVQEKKPWETKDKKVLYELANAIKKISILLYPFVPESSEKIAEKFGGWEFNLKDFETPLDLKCKVVKGENLFNRIEFLEKINLKNKEKINKNNNVEGIMESKEVTFEDFEKLDFRVAEIISVDEIKGADKLFKIELDVGGNLGKRTVCAGLKEYYSIKDLMGRKVVYFSNLKSRILRGIESSGMLLAAVSEDRKKVSLIDPGKNMPNGSRIG